MGKSRRIEYCSRDTAPLNLSQERRRPQLMESLSIFFTKARPNFFEIGAIFLRKRAFV